MQKYCVSSQTNIRETIKKIDALGIGFIVVVNENGIVDGIVTDGDFRRSVLDGVSLSESVLKIANKNFKFLNHTYSKNEAINAFSESVEYLPVLKAGVLVEILKKGDVVSLKEDSLELYSSIDADVVIMAGGFGTRMEPFTKILPKPLIPIGDKTMIEIIMDEYAKFGLTNFHISVNYKAKMIQSYFEYQENNFTISYITENKPLGTAGALKFLDDKIKTPFFISNCDIIIKEDYSKIYDFHLKNQFILTIVTSVQHFKIPYGVCDIDVGGKLKSINEKPEYDFLINTGMYIVNPEALKFIPDDSFFHITDLIEKLIKENYKVGVYPVSEKSYIDVGQWAEYKKAIDVLTL